MAGLVDRRISLLFAGFLALLVFGTLRAAYLGVFRAPSLQRAAATQQTSRIDVPAPRGTIEDRNGTVLAVSESAADIAVTPYLVKRPVVVAQKLAAVLGMPQEDMLKGLARRDTGFVYLARGVTSAQAARVQKLRVDGIQIIPREKREYPRSFLASQLLGTVGTDGGGLAGLEYGLDRVLHGQDGVRTIVSDAIGQPIQMRDSEVAKAGQPIRLTLDATLQDRTEQVLQGVGATYRPKSATAIVMDPRSGSILALANWPRVDANNPNAAPPSLHAMENRAVGLTYEPGSTFKAFTVAGALQQGLVTPQSEFNLPVNLQVSDRTIHDAEVRGPERRSVAQILAQSSNIGAVEIGQRLGASRFDYWVHRFGFGTRTGVDIPGDELGIILHHQQYSGSSMGNLPIGQGESVTPMQMATGYAAIANGGILRPPHVVSAVNGQTVPVLRGHRVISPSVAASLRHMLEGVLAPGGTAHEAAIPGYALAGKTGTANKPDPIHGGYSKTAYVASFMGFAPVKKPKILVAVVVDEPKGAIYGGTVAAPAFQQIVSFAMPYLGIAPQ